MIAVILILAVPVIVLAYTIWYNWSYDKALGFIIGPVLALGSALVGLLIVFLISLAVGPNAETEKVIPLRALANDASASGSFFLGSGTVDEKQVFRYLEGHDDGSYSMEEVGAYKARVVPSDDPRLVVKTGVSSHWWLAGEGLPLDSTYWFYVPEGSIADNYNVAP